MKITIGADPEVFLYDKKEREFVSAHTLIPGTKDKPYPVKAGAVQVDGTAAEFNIHPSHSPAEFVTNVDTVLSELRTMIPPHLEFKYRPTVQYDEKYWAALPEDCKVLGCDPDFDLNGVMNPPPHPAGGVRHGGGHIHIGWTEGKDKEDADHFWDCRQVATNMKLWFGEMDRVWDYDAKRRKTYPSGSFRPKSYGVEIRSFSNAWLKYPKLWPWLYNSIQELMNRMEEGTGGYGIYTGDLVGTMAQKAEWVNRHYCVPYRMPLIPEDFMVTRE
jgi:hypothetical protein